MNINLDDDAMKNVVAGAIMGYLTPEKREEIIKEAVKSLLVVQRNRYGQSEESPISTAFRQAAFDVARQILSRELNDPASDYTRQVKELFEAAWVKVRTDSSLREDMINNIARAISTAFTTER